MRAAAALWTNDLRNVVRDRTVAVLLVLPLLFVVFLRYGLPLAERHAPVVGEYHVPVLALFCLLAGTFPAFMLAFIMLDERDAGLFPVFQVLPISLRELLLLRLFVVMGLAVAYPLLVLAGSGLYALSPARALLLSALCALQAPAITLLIVSVARNKIEGLAVMKGVFPAVLFPVAGILLPTLWVSAFAVLPAYWVYQAFAAPDAAGLLRATAGTVATSAILVILLYRRFRRRVLP